jgi:hypothetical protein
MVIASAFNFTSHEDGAIGIAVYLDDEPTSDPSRMQYMLFWPCGFWGSAAERITITQREDDGAIEF